MERMLKPFSPYPAKFKTKTSCRPSYGDIGTFMGELRQRQGISARA